MSGKSSLEKVGEANKYWAVCGFTTTLQALYELNPGQKALIVGRGTPTAVLAQIKKYLLEIQVHRKDLCNEIEEFTKGFANYNNFSIIAYLDHLRMSAGMKDEDLKAGKYGIALPPHAVVDYLRRMWGAKPKLSFFDTGKNGVVGVSEFRSTGYRAPTSASWKPYNGLIHYVYRSNGKIYSYGKKYNSLGEASVDGTGAPDNFVVQCVIELSR
jgi:hypothetical protein